MSCNLCLTRPIPSYYGSPRRCAFDESGKFTPENWNCETANDLRNFMSYGPKWQTFNSRCDDGSIGLAYIPLQEDEKGDFTGGAFWIMAFWYKERGQVQNLYVEHHLAEGNGGHVLKPMTLKEAEYSLKIFAATRVSKEE